MRPSLWIVVGLAGAACGGGGAGECETITRDESAVLFQAPLTVTAIEPGGGFLYYIEMIDGGQTARLARIASCGGEPEEVERFATLGLTRMRIGVRDAFLGGEFVSRVPLDGGVADFIFMSAVTDIVLESQRVLATHASQIIAIPMNGSAHTVLYDRPAPTHALTLTVDDIVWLEEDPGDPMGMNLVRVSRDGGDPEIVAAVRAAVGTRLVVEDGVAFFHSGTALHAVPLDGGAPVEASPLDVVDFRVDGDEVFVSRPAGIRRIDFTGSSLANGTELLEMEGFPGPVAITPGLLYWIDAMQAIKARER